MGACKRAQQEHKAVLLSGERPGARRPHVLQPLGGVLAQRQRAQLRRQRGVHRLAIAQRHVLAQRELLQAPNVAAEAAQIGLEAVEQRFKLQQHVVAQLEVAVQRAVLFGQRQNGGHGRVLRGGQLAAEVARAEQRSKNR